MLRILERGHALHYGTIYVNNVDIKTKPWASTLVSDDILLMPLLTAQENLAFYLGMGLAWLDQGIYELLKNTFKSGQIVSQMPHNQ